MSIAQNTALFSLLGTTYGGNGVTTFALPNLQGQVPVHWGSAPAGSSYSLGQTGGSENVTLTILQVPSHTHPVNASNTASTPSVGGGVPATIPAPRGGTATNAYAASGDGTTMNPQMVGPAGGSQPHPNMQPYVCVSFIIALSGVFPARN